tara:strand:+ start:221 stop:754 length:534 start_codon:yes stop_codon:yes gene_type:complete
MNINMSDSILNRKVLVLNQSYEPFALTSAKRAVVLVIGEKVDMLEKYNEKINSVKDSFALPSVIKLKFYVKIPYKDLSLTKKNIFKRDFNKCQYCGECESKMTIDHVTPRIKGGKDTWDNLVTACSRCNTKKGGRLLKNINMKLIKKPKKPSRIFHLQSYVNNLQSNWKPYLFMESK